jgi:RNA polymerase sigma-70 factor (ECF subfamily)
MSDVATSTDESAAAIRLVRLTAAGNEGAIEDLYRRYASQVRALAYRMASSEEVCDEVVQEVFIAVWRHAGEFDPERGGVGVWVRSMARHKVIDVVRRHQRTDRRNGPIPQDLPARGPSVDEVAALDLERERILEAVAGLPEVQRAAIELAFWAGMSHTQVAARLGIPLGTAKTRIRTGLFRIRADLARDGLHDDRERSTEHEDSAGRPVRNRRRRAEERCAAMCTRS